MLKTKPKSTEKYHKPNQILCAQNICIVAGRTSLTQRTHIKIHTVFGLEPFHFVVFRSNFVCFLVFELDFLVFFCIYLPSKNSICYEYLLFSQNIKNSSNIPKWDLLNKNLGSSNSEEPALCRFWNFLILRSASENTEWQRTHTHTQNGIVECDRSGHKKIDEKTKSLHKAHRRCIILQSQNDE